MYGPWQLVINQDRQSETGKIRCALDSTVANTLMFKVEVKMPELTHILMRWRSHKFWMSLDIAKMFWAIQTHQTDQNLQHCVWRFNPSDPLMLYRFCRMVMGNADSPGNSRLSLLELADKFNNKFPDVKQIVEEDGYVDDISVIDQNINNVIQKGNQVIQCLKMGNFITGKIMSDNKMILKSVPVDALHPQLQEAIKDSSNETFVTDSKGDNIDIYEHPYTKGDLVQDIKQLGLHYQIDLQQEESLLIYHHWTRLLGQGSFSKRYIARNTVVTWNPLGECGPLINPGKQSLSKTWELQQF